MFWLPANFDGLLNAPMVI